MCLIFGETEICKIAVSLEDFDAKPSIYICTATVRVYFRVLYTSELNTIYHILLSPSCPKGIMTRAVWCRYHYTLITSHIDMTCVYLLFKFFTN